MDLCVELRLIPETRAHGAPIDQHQWEFQVPKMEVLYHVRPYFVGIFPEV